MEFGVNRRNQSNAWPITEQGRSSKYVRADLVVIFRKAKSFTAIGFLMTCVCACVGCKLPSSDPAGAAESSARESERVRSDLQANTGIDAELASAQKFSTPQANADGITLPSGTESARELQLRVAGIEPNSGPVRVAIFAGAESFPNHESATVKVSFVSESASADERLGNIPDGPIAIAVYQDLNNDGQLNRGTFGIPVEPYGFSNNAKGSMGPPSFDAAMISQPDTETVEVTLTKLSF